MPKYTLMITGTSDDVTAVEADANAFAELLKERGSVEGVRIRTAPARAPKLSTADAADAAAILATRMTAVSDKRAGEAAEEDRKRREKEEAERIATEEARVRREEKDSEDAAKADAARAKEAESGPTIVSGSTTETPTE